MPYIWTKDEAGAEGVNNDLRKQEFRQISGEPSVLSGLNGVCTSPNHYTEAMPHNGHR